MICLMFSLKNVSKPLMIIDNNTNALAIQIMAIKRKYNYYRRTD